MQRFRPATPRTAFIDVLDRMSGYEYDLWGHLYPSEAPAVDDPTDNADQTVHPICTYAYGPYGNRTADSLNHTTHFTNDALNRKTSCTLPEGQTETREYGSNGRKSQHTDFLGRITEHDIFGPLEAIDYNDPGGSEHTRSP